MHINEQLEIIPRTPYSQPTIITVIDREEIEVEVEKEGPDGTIHTVIEIEVVETEREEESFTVHPVSIFTRWSRAEKAAIGIYEVVQEAVPEGQYASEWAYEIVGDYAVGTPILVPLPEPEPYVPQTVSRAQAMYVMTAQGIWDQAVAFVEAIEDPLEKSLAKIALYETQEYSRDSPFLTLASSALGLTEEDLDNLFIAADQVKL